jgi:ABC-type Fe3+-hydroxamate transport system substrate-binding protein
MKNAILVACLIASAFVFAGCGGSSNSTTPASNTSANNSSPVVQPEVFAQKKVDIASLTQAVQQYNAAEGHYPATLQDLVPTYIAKVPDAPPGYKLNYDSNSGAVTVVQQ